MSRRTFFVGALVVTLLLAGVASWWASAHPDGLEHVAGTLGFGDTARDSVAAGSPFADYGTTGVDGPAGTGVAGVVGVVVVLAVAGGLAWLLRRRRTDS